MNPPETKASERLLPCPFCGSDDIKEGGDDKQVGAWCQQCHAVGPEGYLGHSDWNTRHPAPGVLEERERDRVMLEKAIATYDPALRTTIGESPAPGVMGEPLAQQALNDFEQGMRDGQLARMSQEQAFRDADKEVARILAMTDEEIMEDEAVEIMCEAYAKSKGLTFHACAKDVYRALQKNTPPTGYNLSPVEMLADIIKAKGALETAKRFYAKKSGPPTPAYLVDALAALEKYGEKNHQNTLNEQNSVSIVEQSAGELVRELIKTGRAWDKYTGTLKASQPKKIGAWIDYNETLTKADKWLEGK